MQAQPPRQSALRTAAVSLAAAAVAAAVGFAAVYVTFGRPDNAHSEIKTAQAPAPAPHGPPKAELIPVPESVMTEIERLAKKFESGELKVTEADPKTPTCATTTCSGNSGYASLKALSTGEMAAFVFRPEPAALPEIKFLDGEGRERTLSEWRGKVVLLNLWATWCLPCRREMPALDRLQKELGSDKFEVVALSVDRKGLEASRKFLDDTKVERLALYVDPSARANTGLRAVGLPATLLIDAQGRELGRLLGPAEWDGEDAVRLIRAALK